MCSMSLRDMQIPKSEKKIIGPPLPNPGDAPGLWYDNDMFVTCLHLRTSVWHVSDESCRSSYSLELLHIVTWLTWSLFCHPSPQVVVEASGILRVTVTLASLTPLHLSLTYPTMLRLWQAGWVICHKWILFLFSFLMEKSILYAKLAVSQNFFSKFSFNIII